MGETIRVGRARAELMRPTVAPRGRAWLVAVTGGIGTGKSSVSRVLARLGGVVADADAIARSILEPGGLAFVPVLERFGTDIVANGRIDRAALAARVFVDPKARVDLEAITHPLIEARVHEILATAGEGGLAVYDVPLLVETGMATMFDAIIVVSAPLGLRLERLEGRGIEREDALRRIRAQANDADRREVATIWIDNVGSVDDLTRIVTRIEQEWLGGSRRTADVHGVL